MDRAQVLVILNELLTLEQNSLSIRLLESTVSISSPFVPVLALVQRMARSSRDHGEGLARLILDLGGNPAARNYSITTTDLHYQDLKSVLQRLVADQEATIRRYVSAAHFLADEPRPLAVVSRVLQQHQFNLQSLRGFSPASKTALV